MLINGKDENLSFSSPLSTCKEFSVSLYFQYRRIAISVRSIITVYGKTTICMIFTNSKHNSVVVSFPKQNLLFVEINNCHMICHWPYFYLHIYHKFNSRLTNNSPKYFPKYSGNNYFKWIPWRKKSGEKTGKKLSLSEYIIF